MIQSRVNHQMITNSSVGYVCHRIIFDQQGQPQDYIFEDFNTSFEELIISVSADCLLGTKLSDHLDNLDNHFLPWVNLYHETVQYQESQATISYVSSISKWVEVQTHLVANTFLVGIFNVLDEHNMQDSQKREYLVNYINQHDRLTTLYNRAYFEDLLQKTNNRSCLPTSVMMGDVNGLKLTNDVFGHDAGDKLLHSIAMVLKQSISPTYTVARWGGDEFVILMPNTSEIEADKLRKKIYQACRDTKSEPIELSISLGFATKTSPDDCLIDALRRAEDHMYANKLTESKLFRQSIIKSLKKILYERTNETPGHTQRVTDLALKLGAAIGLVETRLDELRLLGVLHDVGTIAISNSLLTKSSNLSLEEWRELKKHPEIGYRIAQASPELVQIAEGILSHHEHWDGSGYPQGLAGRSIPLISRIVTIADAYDVMTHPQSYKGPLTPAEAIEELKNKSGSQFDPLLVKKFIEIMAENQSNNQQTG